MRFSEQINRELMDVSIPGIFVTNNMSSLSDKALKLYIYIRFLSRNCMEFKEEEISKKLRINAVDLKSAFEELEAEEIILKTVEGYEILDLKEQEINKTYVPKLKPVKSAKTEVEQRRIAAATAINESFFQGIMALSWYVDISTLFEKYGFDEDVMIALFHECSERNALKKNYVFKVAETWYLAGVKTFEQLEDYSTKQEAVSKIQGKIKSKLRLNRSLTEYEEAYLVTWIDKFKYTFDEIDYAIKKASAKGNTSIGYLNGILKNWYEAGKKNLTDILQAEEVLTKEKINNGQGKRTQISARNLKHKNYEQRKNVDLNEYYDNL